MAVGSAASLFLRYGADVADAIRGVHKVTGAVVVNQRQVARASDVWGGFLGRLAKVGLAAEGVRTLAGVVRGVTGSIVGLGYAAEREAFSQRQLGYAIDRMTGSAGSATESIEAYIGGLSELTGVARGEFRSSFVTLLRQYGSVTWAQRRLADATDLMASGYGDLASSVRGLDTAFDEVALRRGIGPITGVAAKEADSATVIFRKWGMAVEDLRQQMGVLFLPALTKGFNFATKALKAFGHIFTLFSGDVTGPKLGSLGKVWTAVFGTELPKPIAILIGLFKDVGEKLGKFIDDILGTTDREGVEKAITEMVTGVKNIVTTKMTELGKSLDELGLVGFVIKASAVLGVLNMGGITASLILDAVRTGITALGFVLALTSVIGAAFTIAIGMGVVLGVIMANYLDDVIKGQVPVERIIGDVERIMIIAGLTLAAAGAVAGAPIAIALGLGVLLGIVAFKLGKSVDVWDIGEKVKTWIWNALKSVPIFGGLWQFYEDALTLTIGFGVNLIGGTPSVGGGGAGPAIRPGPGEWTPPITGPVEPPRQVNPFRPPPEPQSAKATLGDIYAAYERITGATISYDYARDLLGQGFSYAQVAGQNVFTGEVRPVYGAHGWDGIVTGPRVFVAGEGARPERVTIAPLGEPMPRGAAAGAPTFITNVGTVDSTVRIDELQRAQARLIRLYGS